MQKHNYNSEIRAIIEREGWGLPLPPVKRLTSLSRWHQAAFWGLRVYVTAMLGVVAYAFFHGVR